MANEEHLRMLEQGVEVWNRWRRENPKIWPDLREADFEGANLSRANLSRANLFRADFHKADLRWANLRWAKLRQADLSEADLSGADLHEADLTLAVMACEEHLEILRQGVEVWNQWLKENPGVRLDLNRADLSEAHLVGANLEEAHLIEADLHEAHLIEADLRRADLRRAKLSGADLSRADLSGADLSGADLSGAKLYRADLSGANLSGANLSGAYLREAYLSSALLYGARLSGANLSGTDLSEANLSGADLSSVLLYGARLSGADLRGADLRGADLRGVHLSGVHLSGAYLSGAYLSEVDFGEALDAAPASAAPRGANLREKAQRLTERLLAGVRGAFLRLEEFRGVELREAEVDFTAFYPMPILPERWYKLLAYVHLPSAFEFVLADSRTQLATQARDFATGRDRAAQLIKQGAEIVIVPELPGCRFNPPRTSLLWLEDWHGAEFRLQAEPDLPGFKLDVPVTGRVSFYVGPVLIGEVQITVYISRDGRHTDPERPHAHETAKPYQAVFVPYSHKDRAIVDRLERAYRVLGMEYLRDVRILRSGEKWNPALLDKIEEADIFQLCWSYAAKGSGYVEQEWRHALGLRRSYFIRPVYWEKPMPAPPSELSDMHFAYLELEHEDRAA
jgi:uncharacterized protein YjbI with pentapeptide repeats